MSALTTQRKIEAIVHTKIDAARRRTVAKTIALDRLSAFLGDAAPALQPPALPWVDLEIRPAFREPVEICVDCPEKATESTAFKVRFPRLVRCLRGWSCLFDGVIGTISRRWRHWDDVASMASSSRDSSRVFGGDASTGVSLDVMFWMMESQSHEVAKTHAERGTKKNRKNNTGPGPARARGGLARGATSQTKLLRPRPRPRRGRRRGGARKSFGAVRARRHVGAARGLGRAAAPQGAQGFARLRRRAASKVHA